MLGLITNGINPDLILYNICLIIFLTILFFNRQDIISKKQFFRHSYFIILGFLIVHFQYYIDLLLNNSSITNAFIWVDSNVINKSILVASIGLIAFFIGYLTFTLKINKQQNYPVSYSGTRFLKIISFFFLSLYFYFANPLYFFGNYGVIDIGSEASYIVVLFEVCILAIIIQNTRNMIAYNKDNLNFISFFKQQGISTNVILSVYLISVLTSGDRGPILFYVLAYLANFFYLTKRNIKLSSISIFIFLGAFFLTFLGNYRAISNDQNMTSKLNIIFSGKFENRFNEPSFFPQTQNLATSVRCLHHAVDYVPNNHYFLLGRFQLQQISSVIPFFSNINKLFYKDNHIKYRSSADFITWKNQGEYPWSGDGTTVVADFYLDFGVFGVIVGLFFVGYITRYAEILMFLKGNVNLIQHTIFIVLICFSFYLARSSFLILAKTISWTYFFLIMNSKLYYKYL
jgi:hypothetical protein